MPTLALIDGNSIAYRAFYALPDDLATKSGQVTNAVFGFTRMLIRLLKDHHPEGIAVAWDVSRQTFRTESYPEYKANRSKAPDHFRSQLPLIDEVLTALNVTQLRMEGYEADDIIATVAKQATAEGWNVLIVTGDRDAFQLVGGPVEGHLHPPRDQQTRSSPTRDMWIENKLRHQPPTQVCGVRSPHAATTPTTFPGVPGCGGEDGVAAHRRSRLDRRGLSTPSPIMTPKLRGEPGRVNREQVFLNRELMERRSTISRSGNTSIDRFRHPGVGPRPRSRTSSTVSNSTPCGTDLEDSALPSTGGASRDPRGGDRVWSPRADRIAPLAEQQTPLL